MSELNPKDNPRFYDVAHEFGLIVEGEAHLHREERRGAGMTGIFKSETITKGKQHERPF